MATKTKTTTVSWSRVINFISFWAVMCIAIALILAKIFSGNQISSAFTTIGNILSYIVALATSFSYAYYKRNIWYYIAWVVALVLIVLFIILK